MTSRLSTSLLLVVAFAVVGGAAYLFMTRDDVDAVASAPPAAAPQEPAPDLPLLQAPAPTRAPAQPQSMIRYPDGTYMPALNGVKVAPPLQWHGGPFSPIIGKRVAAGVEWYVHADGTQTTSVMTWRSDLGREDAVCHVARPLAPLPVEPPEAETPKGQPDPKKGPDPNKSDERGATGDR